MTEMPDSVAAWRCEECRNWQPSGEEVHAVVVLEMGPDVDTADMVERIYYARRLRVCYTCRAEITRAKLGYEDRRRR